MKFTDGYWLMRPGVKPHYAAQAYEVNAQPDRLDVLATTRVIRHRGDTLQGPTLNVTLSSPAADVIRVQASHFKGRGDLGPAFALFPDPTATATTDVNDTSASLTSGQLTARLARGDQWSLEFLVAGEVVTSSPSRGLGYMEVGEECFVHEQLNLAAGECVYGLGERFTPFVKNGQVVEIWNEDGGTGSDQAYKNVPFYMTNRGYGVFVNHPERVSFEVASEKVSRVQFSVPGENLDYFVIYGPTPKEILRKYTALTGRAALPPAWSFGLWLTTSFTTNYDESTITEFIQGFADRDLPLHTFHFDCFWMRAFRWCDFAWDPAVFPDPKGMLQRLHERGLKTCVWINPYIAQQSPLFDEGKREGFLLKRPNGDVWQWDMWQPGMAIVDFTNPGACEWYASYLRRLMDQGVDAFKTDFGERIPTDVAWFDGSDPQKMHNYYTQIYNKTVFETIKAHRGEGDAVVFARSATAGGQMYPVHWGGDCYSSFESMAESLRGGLSLGLSGFGFWSHDIGGFEGLPPVDVYKRWLAFGLMSSHSRLHGSTSYRVPWLYDDEACDVLRKFTNLKCVLMPYLFGQAVQAKELGTPLMRAMMLEFPNDRTCAYLDRQYMLGESLLVAPIFSATHKADYYLPPGNWTQWFTGEVAGNTWRDETHDFMSMPIWIRPESVIPMQVGSTVPEYDLTKEITFFLYEISDGHRSETPVYDLKGNEVARLRTTRAGTQISCEIVSGSLEKWSARGMGAHGVTIETR